MVKSKNTSGFISRSSGEFYRPDNGEAKETNYDLELVGIEKHVKSPEYQWMGRKLKDCYAIARAFVAKAVYGF